MGSVCILIVPPPTRLTGNGLEKVAEGGQSVWAPAIHEEDQDEILGSLLWPGLAPAVVVIWGASQWIKDLSFCNSFIPSVTLTFK